LKVDVWSMAFGRRQIVFAIDDVGGPACRFADATQIAPTLVESLIHNDNAIRTETLDQPVELPALLFGNFPSDIEQLIEGVAVTGV
jgi:hypothetical protein